MRFIVVVALLAASQLTIAQFNTQQKKISNEQRVVVKKPNAFLHAVKIPSMLLGMGVYACASDRVIDRYKSARKEMSTYQIFIQRLTIT